MTLESAIAQAIKLLRERDSGKLTPQELQKKLDELAKEIKDDNGKTTTTNTGSSGQND